MPINIFRNNQAIKDNAEEKIYHSKWKAGLLDVRIGENTDTNSMKSCYVCKG